MLSGRKESVCNKKEECVCFLNIWKEMQEGNIGSFGEEIWVARQMWNERDFTGFWEPFEL